MKKMFWGTMALLITVSMFFSALPVFADNGDNFKKAGEQALKEREALLSGKKADIEAYALIPGADYVVTKDEMLILRDKVRDFERTKKEADKYLEFYELKTSIELDKRLSEVVTDYFDRHSLYKRDFEGRVKRYFVEVIGRDVVVQTGVVVDTTNIVLMSIAAIFFFLMIICWRRNSRGEITSTGGGVTCGMLFAFMVLLLSL